LHPGKAEVTFNCFHAFS